MHHRNHESVTETTDAGGGSFVDRPPLLPDRHPTGDFFVCDFMDAIPKDDLGSMEHPLFSLSTKPDHRTLKYEHNGITVEIEPGKHGLATIHDKDILIYCVSQLIAKMKAGQEPKRKLILTAHDLLISTNRETSGDGYRRLKEAFTRLGGTQIITNIETGGMRATSGFHLLDEWHIVERTEGGRMIRIQVTLSEWMYRAAVNHEVLTLHRDYFRLRKPLERRIYELARKHCGRKDEWSIRLSLLQKKSGSNSPLRVFRAMLRDLVQHDHLPDYRVQLDEDDLVTFLNRGGGRDEEHIWPQLDPETYHDAKTLAPGWDIYALELSWREFWVESGKPELRDPDKAFIAFCRKRGEKQRLIS